VLWQRLFPPAGAVPFDWVSAAERRSYFGRGYGHAGWGGLPHEGDPGGGEAVGLVDQIAEGALQGQGFGGEGSGGFDGAGVFAAQPVKAGGR